MSHVSDRPSIAESRPLADPADQGTILERARRKVRRLAAWYRHAGVYLAVNVFVWGIFLVGSLTGSGVLDRPWPLPMSLGWGLGLLIHGLSVWSFGLNRYSDWESRKVEQYVRSELAGRRV